MIVFTVASRTGGADTAEANYAGQHFQAVSRNGVTMALARQLVAAGMPDVPWQARGIDGRVRFTVRSLHRLAGLTVHDGDRLRICQWMPREAVPVERRGDVLDGFQAPAATQLPSATLSACSTASVAAFQLMEAIEE